MFASNKQHSFRARLAVGTALATMALSYGGRPAYAGTCTGAAGVYSCTGAANVLTDSTNGGVGDIISPNAPLTITTTSGFGLDTSTNGGSGFLAVGRGTIFTDNYASAITGAERGMFIINNVTGSMAVTTTGQVTGNAGEGIFARNDSGTAHMTVSAASVSGTTRGIYALSGGSGIMTVTSTGTVTASAGNGISASDQQAGTDINITANNVTGSASGIDARNVGTGARNISVTVSGAVTGGAGNGIYTLTGSTGASVVTLNSGAVVTGSSAAIKNDSGASTTIVNTGASVNGTISLGSGDDDLTFNGGTFTGVAAFIGGAGTDSLTFSNVTGTVVGGAILGMENVTANAGASMAFTGAIVMDGGNNNVTFDNGTFSGVTSFNGGAGTDSLTFRNLTGALAGGTVSGIENVTIGSGGNVSLSGTLDVNTITVENGGILGGTGTINGNVGVTTGTLSVGNSPGLLNIVGNLDLGVASTTLVELGGLTAGTLYDQTDVVGTATLTAGATFDVDFFGAFTAGLNDTFDVLIADTILGDANTLNFDFTNALLALGLEWSAAIVDNGVGRNALRLTVGGLSLTAPAAGDTIALPEPSGIALFVGGLLGLIGLGRRRKTG
jgi:hypothetical protein